MLITRMREVTSLLNPLACPTVPYCNPKYGSCLYITLVNTFGFQYTIFTLGVLPLTTRLSAHSHTLLWAHRHRVLENTYCEFGVGRSLGHISNEYFPGCRKGVRISWLFTYGFADDRYSNGSVSLSSSFLSPAIPALGGVRLTLSQLPSTAVSGKLNENWSPATFPRQTTNVAVDWNVDEANNRIQISRKNDYLRTFPEASTRARLPSLFSTNLMSTMLFTPIANLNHFVQSQYDRRWLAQSPVRGLSPTYANLAKLLDGDMSREALVAADQIVAIDRFMDTRGNRQVAKWEADQWPRWMDLANFARWANARQSYREVSYRLWSRYFIALTGDELSRSMDNVGVRTPVLGTQIALTHINATPVLGPNALNPEAAMWTDIAQTGLRNGTKQFIDAQGLSTDELIELISAIAPLTDADNIPRVRTGVGASLRNYIAPHSRYLYHNQTDEIFIHHGNSPLPDQGLQDFIRDRIFRAPRANRIGAVIRQLAVRNGAASDILSGLEMVMYRGVGYRSNDMANARHNIAANEYIHCDGNVELHSVRNLTAPAYFDSLRTPAFMPPEVQYMLAMQSTEALHNLVLVSHARAVSLTWAGFTTSMNGRTWRATLGQENNQFVANHIDVWLRTYGMENLNLWTTTHANAMAFQFGFAPSQLARSTEALRVVNWWGNFQTPYLVNHYLELWMMEIMPSFMVLPYSDDNGTSHPTWEQGYPSPVSDYTSFQGDIQLGRDLAPLTGRTWLGDGGYTRNAQFYAAQGANDVFRYEGQSPNFRLAHWQHQMVHQFPQNPANENPVWMEAAGSPFADFLLPGSIQGINLEQNRSYAWGVRLEHSVPRTDPIWQRWYQLGLQTPRQSLMVNYVHPIRQKREIEALEDYSVLIWEDGNRFAGMSLVRYDLPDGEAGIRFNPDSIPLPSSIDLPAHRAAEVTTTAKPRVTARRPFTSDDTASRLARLQHPQKDNDADVRLNFESKYPLTQEQLPRMSEVNVRMDSEGVSADRQHWTEPHLRNQEDISRADAVLQAYEQRAYEADRLAEEHLMAEQAAAAARRSLYADQQRRVNERVAKRRSEDLNRKIINAREAVRRASLPPVSNTRVQPGATVHTNGQGTGPRFNETTTVVPNDSAAGGVQAALVREQRDLQAAVDVNNSLRPHSTHLLKERSRIPSRAPSPVRNQVTADNNLIGSTTDRPRSGNGLMGQQKTPFDELATRMNYEKGGGGPDSHATLPDREAMIPSFEELEELKEAENKSGV